MKRVIPRRARRFGGLLTPKGVYVVEYRDRRGGGVDVVRHAQDVAESGSPREAVARLAELIERIGGAPARVSLAIRGFGSGYHALELPPADAEVLRPVVTREVRRIHPLIEDPVVAFVRGENADAAGGTGEPRDVRAAAASRALVEMIRDTLAARGIEVEHLTVLPVGLARVMRRFVSADEPAAVLVALPAGPVLGFFHGGELRLFREPPADALGDADERLEQLAREVERGDVFVRQRHRGVRTRRVVVLAGPRERPRIAEALRTRLEFAVEEADAGELPPGALIALGAALGEPEPSSFDLLRPKGTVAAGAARLTRALSIASAAVFAGAALWWAIGGMRVAVEAESRTGAVEQRIEERLPSLGRIEPVIAEREAHAERIEYRRGLDLRRRQIQRTLEAVALATPEAVRLGSLRMSEADGGWRVTLAGRATGYGSADAARAVDRLYRELPRRIELRDLTLVRFEPPAPEPGDAEGADGADAGPAAAPGDIAITFEMSFISVARGPEADR